MTLKDVRNFLSYSLGTCGIIIYFIVCSLSATAQLSISLFLAEWASQPLEEQQKVYYPRTMGILVAVSFTAAVLRETTIFSIIIRSSSNLHNELSKKMLRAKIEFFDSTPIGTVLTLFSKDMALCDYLIPPITVLISYGIFRAVSVSIAICVVNYWLLIPLLLAIIYFTWQVKRASQAMIET